MTRAQAINANCLDCCVGNKTAARCCSCTNCPVRAHRFGPNPQGGYCAFLGRDLFEGHGEMEQSAFNRVLLVQARLQSKNGVIEADGQSK